MDENKKNQLIERMTENLPVLRSKLSITQSELGDRVGVSRHTLIALENRQRVMTWSMYLSLLYVFCNNEGTKKLVEALEIYDEELIDFITFKQNI